MKTYVLDASSILRFTDKEAGFDQVRNLLHAAAKGEVALLLSAVNWGEIVCVLHKRMGPRDARKILANLASLPIAIVAVDAHAAEAAGAFKADFNIPYADAFAGSLALEQQATLVTADNDFKKVSKSTVEIEFLPNK
jgi:predicted nucleic acid-binding protein